MGLYPLPTTFYVARCYACSWRIVIKEWTDKGFVDAGESREAMAGKSGDSTKVRLEGESRVKGNTKGRRDDLALINDALNKVSSSIEV